MSGVLRNIKLVEELVLEDRRHPIIMWFSDNNSEDLFPYRTTLEVQFGTEIERKKGINEKKVKEKLSEANSYIGCIYDINLYRLSVSELTNGKFVGIEDMDYFDVENLLGPEDIDFQDDSIIYEYKRATYMTKHDLINYLRYRICLLGMESQYYGVNKDGDTEDIESTLFFENLTEKPKQYNIKIPYEKYGYINKEYIIFKMPIDKIRNGQSLAFQLNDYKIESNDECYLVELLNKYRKYVQEVKEFNSKWYNMILFWKKEQIVDLEQYIKNVVKYPINQVMQFFKDSYILSCEFPEESAEAKQWTLNKSYERLYERYNNESILIKKVRDNYKQFNMELSKKYNGKHIIKILN